MINYYERTVMSTPEIKADTQTPQAGSEQPVDYEKRYKDLQAAYTKSQQDLKATKAKVEVLADLTKPQVELSLELQAELEDLKFSDPDAWRTRMNGLEKEVEKKYLDNLSEVDKQARMQAELERRTQVLTDFNQRHPELQITDDVINLDIPSRFTKKLEKGEISFEDFLEEIVEYLKSPKVVGSANKTLEQPNLSKVGGDSTPTKGAIERDLIADYNKNKIIF